MGKDLSLDRSSHAVVIGASVAGLLAARVLQDYVSNVTLVDRDRLPDRPMPRPGTPQAAHQHVLLLRGLRIVERLFPGFRDELIAQGAPVVDMAADMAWLTGAGWAVRFASDLKMLTSSRELLEITLRRRLLALGRASVVEGLEVSGLLRDGQRITGVRARARGTTNDQREIRADLVVDASGRHSRLPDWLDASGFDRPDDRVVNGHLGYSSRIYRFENTDRLTWRGAYVQPAPPRHTRGGVLLPVENDAWHLTLVGVGGDYPPVEEGGFLDFAKSLRDPILFDVIRDAEPLTTIAGYRAMENRWRRCESKRWPDRLLVVGDAACAFNPVYAQGMTTAARAAETLERMLARNVRPDGALRAGFGRRFQRALARVNAGPWRMATAQDLRLPQTTGARAGLTTRLLHRYMDRIMRLTIEREDVRLAFLRTMHMLDAPSALFAPRIFLRAMRARPRPAPTAAAATSGASGLPQDRFASHAGRAHTMRR